MQARQRGHTSVRCNRPALCQNWNGEGSAIAIRRDVERRVSSADAGWGGERNSSSHNAPLLPVQTAEQQLPCAATWSSQFASIHVFAVSSQTREMPVAKKRLTRPHVIMNCSGFLQNPTEELLHFFGGLFVA